MTKTYNYTDTICDLYRCIGDDLRGYFVETRYPTGMMWIVPGTYRDDPSRVVEAK